MKIGGIQKNIIEEILKIVPSPKHVNIPKKIHTLRNKPLIF